MESIGQEIKRIRKLRSLSRQRLAALLDVTTQTIANIEENRDYNLSLNLLERTAKALGATVTIRIEENPMDDGRIAYGNDEAILYIRKNYPNCRIPNNILGKMIWEWLQERGGRKAGQHDRPSLWGNEGPFVDEMRLPKTATQFEFDRGLLVELYNYLDLVGLN